MTHRFAAEEYPLFKKYFSTVSRVDTVQGPNVVVRCLSCHKSVTLSKGRWDACERHLIRHHNHSQKSLRDRNGEVNTREHWTNATRLAQASGTPTSTAASTPPTSTTTADSGTPTASVRTAASTPPTSTTTADSGTPTASVRTAASTPPTSTTTADSGTPTASVPTAASTRPEAISTTSHRAPLIPFENDNVLQMMLSYSKKKSSAPCDPFAARFGTVSPSSIVDIGEAAENDDIFNRVLCERTPVVALPAVGLQPQPTMPPFIVDVDGLPDEVRIVSRPAGEQPVVALPAVGLQPQPTMPPSIVDVDGLPDEVRIVSLPNKDLDVSRLAREREPVVSLPAAAGLFAVRPGAPPEVQSSKELFHLPIPAPEHATSEWCGSEATSDLGDDDMSGPPVQSTESSSPAPRVPAGKKRQRSLTSFGMTFGPKHIMCIAFASTGLSFRLVQNRWFRMAFSVVIHDRTTLRREMIATDKLYFEKTLELAMGRVVTLAIDSGTVWRRWLAIVCHASNFPSFLVDISNAQQFENNALSGANMNARLQHVISMLTKSKVYAVAVVADNAASMHCSDMRIPGLVWIRCGAHLFQLLLKDLFQGELATAKETAESLRNKSVKLPRFVPTRWNSVYDLLVAISKDYNQFPQLLPEQIVAIENAITVSRPICIATDLLQSDRATAFELACHTCEIFRLALDGGFVGSKLYFEHLNTNSERRAEWFMQPIVLVILFFSPSFDRLRWGHRFRNAVKAHVCSWTALLTSVGRSSSEVGKELDELATLTMEVVKGPVTHENYMDYWAQWSSGAPGIYDTLQKLLRLTPTEAAVEREFSVTKHIFRPSRSSLSDGAVAAQVRLHSLANQIRLNDPSLSPLNTNSEKPTRSHSAEPIVLSDAHVSAFVAFATNEYPVDRRLPVVPAAPTRKCAQCGLVLHNHANQSHIQCKACFRFWAATCLQMDAHTYSLAKSSLSGWRCADCFKAGRGVRAYDYSVEND